jgi:hypothetical protein
MIKLKGIVAILICVLMLTSCSPNIEKTPEATGLTPPDLSTEEGLRDYLVGEWHFFNEFLSQVLCDMTINEDLSVHLLFHDIYGGESKGEYTGKINLDRLYAEANEAPDLIVIDLIDSDYPGGDFFFEHRTVYDERRVMSLFFAGNGNCIFDLLGSEEFQIAPDEIVFEKETGEKSGLEPIKNGEFHAVLWGIGDDQESLWIDDVNWSPKETDDDQAMYPWRMTAYENDAQESILYKVDSEMSSEIFGDDLFTGDVYFVRTDENGHIIEFVAAEYKVFLEEGLGGVIDAETEAAIFDIIDNDVPEINEFVNSGLVILLDGETVVFDGEDSYLVRIGGEVDGEFYEDYSYAVNIDSRVVHWYDVLTDSWYVY